MSFGQKISVLGKCHHQTGGSPICHDGLVSKAWKFKTTPYYADHPLILSNAWVFLMYTSQPDFLPSDSSGARNSCTQLVLWNWHKDGWFDPQISWPLVSSKSLQILKTTDKQIECSWVKTCCSLRKMDSPHVPRYLKEWVPCFFQFDHQNGMFDPAEIF